MSPSLIEQQLPLAAAYVAFLYACAWLCAFALQRVPNVSAARSKLDGRFGCIDGLRGMLALGVMMHHTLAGYGYFSGGTWRYGDSPLLNQLGQSGVALFFMITGFLFSLKARSSSMNWRHLYASRAARLYPLYLLLVLVVFALAIGTSQGGVREPLGPLLGEFVRWLAFGQPDINGQSMTWTMIAGVNWSLRYEVVFYIVGVPLLYLFAKGFAQPLRAALSCIALGAVLVWSAREGRMGGSVQYVTHFLSGISVAYLSDVPRSRAVIAHRGFHAAAGLALVWLLCNEPHANNWRAVLAETVVFAAVVGGASAFGLLRTRAAVWLGDVSYGIYLLHGLSLWTLWYAACRFIAPQTVGTLPFTLAMGALVAAVCVLASISYVWIERPALQRWARPHSPPRLQAI